MIDTSRHYQSIREIKKLYRCYVCVIMGCLFAGRGIVTHRIILHKQCGMSNVYQPEMKFTIFLKI